MIHHNPNFNVGIDYVLQIMDRFLEDERKVPALIKQSKAFSEKIREFVDMVYWDLEINEKQQHDSMKVFIRQFKTLL